MHSYLCTTTTLRTQNFWSLLKGGRCSEVVLCHENWKQDIYVGPCKQVVVIRRWSLTVHSFDTKVNILFSLYLGQNVTSYFRFQLWFKIPSALALAGEGNGDYPRPSWWCFGTFLRKRVQFSLVICIRYVASFWTANLEFKDKNPYLQRKMSFWTIFA